MSNNIQTRCCIVGGGPAGIMLGYLLARAGIHVTVLEKWPDFFRDFRGDTIHPSTMDALYELDLLEDFLKLPHNKTRQMLGHIGGEEIPIADFTRLSVRCPFIAFIPQWDFLNFLSSKAKVFPTFHLMTQTQAIDVLEEKGRLIGVRVKNSDKEFNIFADLVIGADGRHSIIREKALLEVNDLGAPIDVLWFRISRKKNDETQSFGYIDNGNVLVMLNRGEYWQCGFIIPKDTFGEIQERGLEQFKKDIAALAPFVSKETAEIQSWEQIKLLSVRVDCLKTWYKKGLLCIGDAAHAMSPIGGIGINLAIQDAIAAANILVPAFQIGVPNEHHFKKIQQRRRFATYITQRLQTFMHRRVLAPVLKNRGHLQVPLFARLLKRFPILQGIPAYFVGIGFRPEHISKR